MRGPKQFGWSMSNTLNATIAADALAAIVKMERVHDHLATPAPKAFETTER